MEQRFTFDQTARLYNSARPGYPVALRDEIASIAGLRPGDAILEVGCGTGLATRAFAPLGCQITALDPGPQMIEVARESSTEFANIEWVVSTFEDWPAPPAAFRLVMAGQSWHWVAPEVRYAKAARTLRPDGFLAVFGNTAVRMADERLEEDLERIILRLTGFSGPPPETRYLPSGPFAREIDASGLFGPVTHRSYPWRRRHSAASWVDLMQTHSDFLLLPRARREELAGAISAAIEARGGAFEIFHEAHLYLARRAA